jgi:polyisoprenoid-binding protein YceI
MSKLERSFRYLLAWGTVAASATALGAQRPVADAVLRSGTLSFHGRATVGDFVGTTSSVTGVIAAGSDYGGTTGWVEAPVATLLTGNDRRDRDLRASMEVERFPAMRFTLSGVTVVTSASLGAAESMAVLLHGILLIHGVARHVDLPATIVREGDTTHVTTAFPLDLHDYDIGGLTKMLGMLRMQPGIDVRVDLRFVDGPPVLSGAP